MVLFSIQAITKLKPPIERSIDSRQGYICIWAKLNEEQNTSNDINAIYRKYQKLSQERSYENNKEIEWNQKAIKLHIEYNILLISVEAQSIYVMENLILTVQSFITNILN